MNCIGVLKCGVVDCDNDAVCVGDEDGFPCCDDHCGHGGDDCTMIVDGPKSGKS